MKVLFIGGTGNISAECAARLHEEGHAIAVISRGRHGVPAQYQAVVADRHDAAAMRAALERTKAEVVLNFIGYEPEEVRTDFEVFQGAVAQYVFISSTTVYERPASRLPLTESAPLGNRWWEYARKKLACEQWLMQRFAENGFPVTIVRPSQTYSKRWAPNPVASSSYTFAARLEQGLPVFVPDDGENPWTLAHARDFAAGLAGLVGRHEAVGQAYHITGEEVLTWNRICAEIAEAVGATSPDIVRVPTDFICQEAPHLIGTLKGDKAHPGVFDNSKIKSLVPGFDCRTPFRAGIRESVAWLRAHPEEQNLNPQVDEVCERVVRAWRSRREQADSPR
jgi:nucleoside-diphosphate-sugar epimerase